MEKDTPSLSRKAYTHKAYRPYIQERVGANYTRSYYIHDPPIRFNHHNTDYDISLYPWFTEEEKFDLWSANNLSQYLRKANSIPGKGLPVAIAKPLLKDMLVTSQAAIDGNGVEANLRFAHGENTIPLLALLGIENAAVVEADPEKVAEVWQDFKYNPMATNIQWILYKNTDGKILVKVLFNEQETKLPIDSEYAPYYDWELFQKYCEKQMAKYPDTTPAL